MKIRFCYILLFFAVIFNCAGCNTEPTDNETKENIENRDTEQEVPSADRQYSTEFAANIYKCITNPDTGEKKYGLYLGEDIVYSGEPLEIGVKLYANMGTSSYNDIPVLCMLILDGKMIPFSMDGDENGVQHALTIKNAVEGTHSVIFTPYGVSGQTSKQLLFMAIPFYDKGEVTIFENDILACQKKIISEGGEVPPETYEPGSGYIFTEDLYSLYQKNIQDISDHVDEVMDYIVQSDNGELHYTADSLYEPGQYLTILVCDGELYNGFDDRPYLLWEKKEDGYMDKQIKTENLAKGKHTIFAVTVDFTNDNFCVVKKAMNTEVEINE
ncbi:MAG: hypothetical protein HFI34_03820 [Lachnospiraceae bacterium]|nr:hypothetical protein [Lachnospiraceae bacterium]